MKYCNEKALLKSVNTAQIDGNFNHVISKVFDRMKKVLALINKGRGGNDMVKCKRGGKYENLKFDYSTDLPTNLCDCDISLV